MPNSVKSGSIPNVRASSGMIGTMRLPICLSRISPRSNPVKAIVVEAARLPDPLNSSSNGSGPGVPMSFLRTRRRVVVDGGAVRRVHLPVVVAAASELAEVVVRKLLDHLLESRVGAEEMLADVLAGFRRVLLELAVDGRVHLVDEHAVDVLRQK